MGPEMQGAEICHPWSSCWVCCLNLPPSWLYSSFTAAPWNLPRLKTSVSTSDPSRKKHFVHYSPGLPSFLILMKEVELSLKVTTQSCRCLFWEGNPSNTPAWFWFRHKAATKAFSAGSGGRMTTPASHKLVFYVSCRGIKY